MHQSRFLPTLAVAVVVGGIWFPPGDGATEHRPDRRRPDRTFASAEPADARHGRPVPRRPDHRQPGSANCPDHRWATATWDCSRCCAGPERTQPWTLFADTGFVYTTNVALTHRNTQDDFLFVAEGGAGYEWKLAKDLTLNATAEEQYFAYDRFSELDFGSLNFALALTYTAHQLDDVTLSAQIGFTRLTHHNLVDKEFFRNGDLSLGAQKLFAIGRAQLVGVSADIDLGVSVPHVAEREEFGLAGNYVIQWTRHFSTQAGVRVAYYLYPDGGRQDFNFSGTVGATYAFAPWCSVGATLSGTTDRSTREVLAYDVLNAGGTVFFRVRF